jgi:putative ABC transport system substrate-binding protein
MRRRDFIMLAGGVALTWPIAARAQQSAMPVVGFLHDGSFEPRVHLVAAFRQGLSDAGFVDGRNVVIEYRWGQDQFDRLPGLAAEFVQRQVAIIATPGSAAAALAKPPPRQFRSYSASAPIRSNSVSSAASIGPRVTSQA